MWGFVLAKKIQGWLGCMLVEVLEEDVCCGFLDVEDGCLAPLVCGLDEELVVECECSPHYLCCIHTSHHCLESDLHEEVVSELMLWWLGVEAFCDELVDVGHDQVLGSLGLLGDSLDSDVQHDFLLGCCFFCSGVQPLDSLGVMNVL